MGPKALSAVAIGAGITAAATTVATAVRVPGDCCCNTSTANSGGHADGRISNTFGGMPASLLVNFLNSPGRSASNDDSFTSEVDSNTQAGTIDIFQALRIIFSAGSIHSRTEGANNQRQQDIFFFAGDFASNQGSWPPSLFLQNASLGFLVTAPTLLFFGSAPGAWSTQPPATTHHDDFGTRTAKEFGGGGYSLGGGGWHTGREVGIIGNALGGFFTAIIGISAVSDTAANTANQFMPGVLDGNLLPVVAGVQATGVAQPWPGGLLDDADPRATQAMLDAVMAGLVVVATSPNRDKYRYFGAQATSGEGLVMPVTPPLTLEEARIYALQIMPHEIPSNDRPAQGVLTLTRTDALDLVRELGGIERAERGPNQPGFLRHMHPAGMEQVHIWYLIGER